MSLQSDAFFDKPTQIVRFTWPTWGPPGSCRPQMGLLGSTYADCPRVPGPYRKKTVTTLCTNAVFNIFVPWHFSGLAWWHHGMETTSALLALCEGNPQTSGNSPNKRPAMWALDNSSNKPLDKHSSGRWSETPWRACDIIFNGKSLKSWLWKNVNVIPWT